MRVEIDDNGLLWVSSETVNDVVKMSEWHRESKTSFATIHPDQYTLCIHGEERIKNDKQT